jgi:hypothetical protein
MNRASPGWKAYAVTAGVCAALGVWSVSTGTPWLGAVQLALAAATVACAFFTFQKGRRGTPENPKPQNDMTDERRPR